MPCMDKMKSETNEKVIQGLIMPLCDKALNHYCLKYDVNKMPAELMNAQEKSDLVHKVLDHERNPKEELDAVKTTI
jgi:dsRNA-specific ribonuclease